MNKVAIYPGTFDPITYGHIDVIKKGLKLFDRIIVAVSDVENKNYLFDSEERIEIVKKEIGIINLNANSFEEIIKEIEKLKKNKINAVKEKKDYNNEITIIFFLLSFKSENKAFLTISILSFESKR